MRSAACLRVIRFRQSGQYLTLLEVDAKIVSMSPPVVTHTISANGCVDALPLTGVNVVFQGVEGAYSYAAMRAYFSDAINSYHVKTFRDAMEEVASGKADYAVLPRLPVCG